MTDGLNKAAFWRLWRELGKAIWAVWVCMQDGKAEDSHRKGMRWERDFRETCEQRGLSTSPPSGREDLLVNGRRTQCKAIDRIHEGWIDISNMRPVKANNGARGYLRSEIDVIALRSCGAIYLIPCDAVTKDCGAIRPRLRVSEIAHFQDNWSVYDFDYTPPACHRQRNLFSEQASVCRV